MATDEDTPEGRLADKVQAATILVNGEPLSAEESARIFAALCYIDRARQNGDLPFK